MTWDKGFNFRGSSSFVIDGADEVSLNANAGFSYPITANGVTFGWEDLPTSSGDCSNSVDARLAGINYVTNGGASARFRVDLPNAGNFLLRAAFTDARGFGWAAQQMIVKDTVSTVHTLAATTVASTDVIDINGVSHSRAGWPANNTSVTKAFATAIARFHIGGAGSDYTVLAHLFISEQAGGGGGGKLFRPPNLSLGAGGPFFSNPIG